jgi:hypothetical protein
MNYIFAAATDTMTGGQVRRLQELAGSSSLKRHNYASDEGGEFGKPSVRVQSNTDSLGWGTISTIERVTMQAARQIATRPHPVNPSRTSA